MFLSVCYCLSKELVLRLGDHRCYKGNSITPYYLGPVESPKSTTPFSTLVYFVISSFHFLALTFF